jgi:hypothetical protein
VCIPTPVTEATCIPEGKISRLYRSVEANTISTPLAAARRPEADIFGEGCTERSQGIISLLNPSKHNINEICIITFNGVLLHEPSSGKIQ